MRRAGILALYGALSVTALAVPSAFATVVVGQSIDGVKLGDTLTQLREHFPRVRVETIRGETSFSYSGSEAS